MKQGADSPLAHHQMRFDPGVLEKLEKPHADDRARGPGYSDNESVVLCVHA